MDAFIGEIRLFPYSFPPQDWAWCTGEKVSIQQYPALNAVIGSRYGGDGKTYFNLPAMIGTVPIGMGAGPGLTPRTLTKTVDGANEVSIYSVQAGIHSHTVKAKFLDAPPKTAITSLLDKPVANSSWLSRAMQVTSPTTRVGIASYTNNVTLDTAFPDQTITPGGGAVGPAAHENRQPFLPLNFCICLVGAFPINPG